jgi:hypothetical protein
MPALNGLLEGFLIWIEDGHGDQESKKPKMPDRLANRIKLPGVVKG